MLHKLCAKYILSSNSNQLDTIKQVKYKLLRIFNADCYLEATVNSKQKKEAESNDSASFFSERKTRLELATLTLARLCSTNWAISAIADAKVDIFLKPANIPQTFFTQKSVHFRQAYKQTFDYQLIRPR